MKTRLLKYVSFMLVMTILTANINNIYAEENSNPLFSFTFNKNQLELSDALAKENPSISGEIFKKTAPVLWSVLDPPSGRYRDFGNHLIANTVATGYEFISTSPWMGYINPYQQFKIGK